jgi:hypothetical protein
LFSIAETSREYRIQIFIISMSEQVQSQEEFKFLTGNEEGIDPVNET